MTFFKSIKKSLLVLSILYCVVGYVLYRFKQDSLRYILQIIAIGLLLAGIISIIRYFVLKIDESYKRNDFLFGLIYITIAAIVYFWRLKITIVIGTILGVMIIVSAILKIQDMIDARKIGVKGIGLYLTLIIVSIALGVLVLIDPFDVETTYIVMGFSLIFCGITDLFSNIFLAVRKAIRDGRIKKEEKAKAQEELKIEREKEEELEALKLEKAQKEEEDQKKKEEEDKIEGKFTRIDL